MNDEYLLPLLMNLCNCQKCRVGIPCKSVNATKDALDDHYAAQQNVQSDGACAHERTEAYEFGRYCKDCGMANPPRR